MELLSAPLPCNGKFENVYETPIFLKPYKQIILTQKHAL